jgi:hypothetical protein
MQLGVTIGGGNAGTGNTLDAHGEVDVHLGLITDTATTGAGTPAVWPPVPAVGEGAASFFEIKTNFLGDSTDTFSKEKQESLKTAIASVLGTSETREVMVVTNDKQSVLGGVRISVVIAVMENEVDDIQSAITDPEFNHKLREASIQQGLTGFHDVVVAGKVLASQNTFESLFRPAPLEYPAKGKVVVSIPYNLIPEEEEGLQEDGGAGGGAGSGRGDGAGGVTAGGSGAPVSAPVSARHASVQAVAAQLLQKESAESMTQSSNDKTTAGATIGAGIVLVGVSILALVGLYRLRAQGDRGQLPTLPTLATPSPTNGGSSVSSTSQLTASELI